MMIMITKILTLKYLKEIQIKRLRTKRIIKMIIKMRFKILIIGLISNLKKCANK